MILQEEGSSKFAFLREETFEMIFSQQPYN